MSEKTAEKREYSPVEAMPREAQHIGFWDSLLTWAGTSLQPAVWTLGGSVICAGVFGGVIATALATIVAFIFIGLFGLMTQKVGTSSCGFSRFALGMRGSVLLSIASTINTCGWCIVGNYMAAITYSYIFNIYFGWPAYGQPGAEKVMVFGCLLNGIVSYAAVGIGGSRLMKIFERIMTISLLGLSVAIFYILFKTLSWQDIVSFTVPAEMQMGFFAIFDMMLATLVTMYIIGGDLSRSMKDKKAVLYAPNIGGTVAILVFIIMGMLGVISTYKTTGVINMDSANPSTLAMNSGLGVVALVIVLFSTVTTNMVDVYTMTNNFANMFARAGFKRAAVFGGCLPMAFCWLPIAFTSFFSVFYSFINVIGALLPPALVIMLIDYNYIRSHTVDISEIDRKGGKYWYSSGFNIYAVISWLVGAVLYFFVHNVWNVAFFSNVLISMAVVAVIYSLLAKVAVSRGYYK